MSKNFIHLRCHSSFSLSEGALKIEDLIDLAKKNNMPALAVTDTGNLFCSLEFSLACAKAGIQPIIGCVVQIDMQVKEEVELSSIVLLAKDEIGFKNLLKLCSMSFLKKYAHYSNHIKFSDLVEFSEGLICLSGGVEGPLGKAILAQTLNQAKEHVLKFKEVFPDRFYIEIMRHGMELEEKQKMLLLI